MTRTLPGIFQISSLPIDELILYPKKYIIAGDKVSAPSYNWSKLPLVGLCSCKVTDSTTDSGIIYTTQIEGVCVDDKEFGSGTRNKLRTLFHAFKIVDIYKNEMLVGCTREPFPEISFTPTIDASPAGTRSIAFTITWIHSLPPIDLIAL